MRVDDDPLDIRKIAVMLQGAHVEPGLFAELCDAGAVVVRQCSIRHDGIRNLGISHQVDFE